MQEKVDMPQTTCAVIIVTHNSQAHFSHCLSALKQQTVPASQIIVVDSGSEENSYLNDPAITLHLAHYNIGFCEGNNQGYALVHPSTDYVLFLNPDAFLTPTFLEQAIDYLNQPEAAQVGALSGILLGFNIKTQKPTGLIDSTGIFRSHLGRWFDRYQTQPQAVQDTLQAENVPALCGALMFCRRHALEQVLLSSNEIMDRRFFMYKEDIDLSIRLRRQGWLLKFLPDLVAYHCRGWHKQRSQVPLTLRLLSARNEMRLHARMKSPYYGASLLKYLFVRWIER
jgi:N-acetylglucosaminyl-diphospho-decaprenol L-rhamnosyltransferase